MGVEKPRLRDNDEAELCDTDKVEHLVELVDNDEAELCDTNKVEHLVAVAAGGCREAEPF